MQIKHGIIQLWTLITIYPFLQGFILIKSLSFKHHGHNEEAKVAHKKQIPFGNTTKQDKQYKLKKIEVPNLSI